MKLASVHLERFGARSNLQLDDLDPQLNVVYGPNGSGKTTIIQFLRWLLYGFADQHTAKYLDGLDHDAGGQLLVLDENRQRRIVSRRVKRPGTSQVSIRRPGQPDEFLHDRRLTGVDLEEYQTVFSFGFDQTNDIQAMVDVAVRRGLMLMHSEADAARLAELQKQLSECQASLEVTPRDHEFDIARLTERQHELKEQIEDVKLQRSSTLREIDAKAHDLRQELNELRDNLSDYNLTLSRTEQSLQRRITELNDLRAEQRQLESRLSETCRQEALDIESQIQQWSECLDSVRQRHQNLQAQVAHVRPAGTHPSMGESEIRGLLDSLGYTSEDIEADLTDLAAHGQAGEASQSQFLRAVLGSALQSMRSDVTNLSSQLQQQRATSRYFDHARELDHLKRCEAELTELISMLNSRRQSLVSSPGAASSADAEDVQLIRPWYREFDRSSLDYSPTGNQANDWGDASPILETRIDFLRKRCELLQRQADRTDSEVRHLEAELERVEASRRSVPEDHILQQLREQIIDLEQQLDRCESWRRQRAESLQLQEEIRRLQANMAPSSIVAEATEILHRLTDGSYRRIRISDRSQVWVEDHRHRSFGFGELSRGTRDQVYLSLALALVAAYRHRGVELPMVLNDIFINIDAERAHATADVLSRFAQRGHQILMFTRHDHIAQLLERQQAKLFSLRERTASHPETPRRQPEQPAASHYYLDRAAGDLKSVSWTQRTAPAAVNADRRSAQDAATETSTPAGKSYDWVARWEVPQRSHSSKRESSRNGTLSLDSPLRTIESIDRQTIARLHELQVETVGDLLALDPELGEQHMARFGITAPSIYRWQSELSLQCYVGLSTSDASLLVACGIDDPDDLAYADIGQLHQRLEQFLSDPQSRNLYGSILRFERSRLTRWSEAAKQCSYQRPPRRKNGQPPHRPTPEADSRPSRSQPTSDQKQRSNDPATATESTRSKNGSTPSSSSSSRPADETLRFYLECSDPVVDAPSIGPKTAERLEAVGIETIEDLLRAEPNSTAEEINYRRIHADLIRQWQRQTTLVCQVPNLRGHDAQILVACDVEDADALAAADPEELFSRVDAFVGSGEGKRILRNGRRPDLEEVSDWVRWAGHARELALSAA